MHRQHAVPDSTEMCLMLMWPGRWHDWQEAVEVKHGINRTTHWRKGSQWNALIRSHAKLAVEDTQLVEAFSTDCKYCQVLINILSPSLFASQSLLIL